MRAQYPGFHLTDLSSPLLLPLANVSASCEHEVCQVSEFAYGPSREESKGRVPVALVVDMLLNPLSQN